MKLLAVSLSVIIIFLLTPIAHADEQMDRQRMEYIVHEVVDEPKVKAIDSYLSGSPMANQGETIVKEAIRTGVNAYLAPAQAEAESSRGAVPYHNQFNVFGMMTGRAFTSFADSISYYFDMILRNWGPVQDAHQLTGYCVPDYPYLDGVDALVKAIAQREAYGWGLR